MPSIFFSYGNVTMNESLTNSTFSDGLANKSGSRVRGDPGFSLVIIIIIILVTSNTN